MRVIAPALMVSACAEELATVPNVERVKNLSGSQANSTAISKPNILLVVADDLGMLDIGAFGGEIRTPNIDRLAERGLRFTQFHTSAVCSPSRAMLLSGADAHAAGLGNMAVHTAPNQRNQPGYEGRLSLDVVSVASLLRDSGYRTYMAGKWHLGQEDGYLPSQRGFDKTFALMDSGASYFSDGLGIVSKRPKATYTKNGDFVDQLPDDFYATDAYTNFIIDQIETDADSPKPFFAYLAYTAVHWPLQVRNDHLDLYKGRYDAGYEALRAERIERAKSLGVINPDAAIATAVSQVRPWEQLDPAEKQRQSRVMELYGAVTERMDYHLGRVLASLDEHGELDKTLIVFMSDNGPDGSDRSMLPGNDVWLPQVMDMSYGNMGKPYSYVWAGPAWAGASVGPSRRFKEFLTEGGIRSPMIVSFPGIAGMGGIARDFVSIKDIAPTLLDFAGTKPPQHRYKGRVIKPMEGTSMKPFLDGRASGIHGEGFTMAWELFGQKAVYKDAWKLLWLTSKPKWLLPPENADAWALYDLSADPTEVKNLIDQQPEKFQELLAVWEQYVEEQSVVMPEWD